jgi:hypothetical protein
MAMVQQRVVVPETAWRAAVRKLNMFTVSELAAELRCSKVTAKKHLDTMAAMDPPLVRPAGRYGRMPMYAYIKPDDAGERFKAQRERRLVLTAERDVDVEVVAERGAQAPRSLVDSVPDKEIQKVCRWAIAQGWRLQQTGGEHIFKLVKPGMRPVTVPSTPRNSGAAADMMRKKLSERSTHQRLRRTA